MRAAGLFFRAAEPLADALKAKLAGAGIRPIVDCDNPQVVVSRQSQADVEYFFAVNAAWDEKEGTLPLGQADHRHHRLCGRRPAHL